MSSMKLSMPPGILNLHIINILTTFSYAVLYSSLTIYLTKTFHISHDFANGIVGLFIAVNFALHLLSGYIGGRLLSNRALFTASLLFQIMGIYVLGLPGLNSLFVGLSLFLIGCGINVTCYNCIFTQQFEADDSRRETAFFYNYCAMNVGFFLGFIVSGFFDLRGDYQSLLYVSNLFNILTLIVMCFSWKYLADKGLPFIKLEKKKLVARQCFGYGLLVLLIPVIFIAFQRAGLANDMVLLLGIGVLLFIYFVAEKKRDSIEKNKIHAFLILSIASIIFWMLYYVGPIGITHFLKYNVNASIYDYQIPPQWIMNLNAIFIIAGSPILAFVFTVLRRRGFDVSVSKQFAYSLVAIALSFFSLSIGIFYSNPLGLTAMTWVIVYFLIQAIAELLIAPVGFAMIGKLAPANLQGIMMGLWLMVPGISASLAQYCSNSMTRSESINPLVSNPDYFYAFNQTGLYALISAAALLLLSSKIEKFINAVAGDEPCQGLVAES